MANVKTEISDLENQAKTSDQVKEQLKSYKNYIQKIESQIPAESKKL